MILRAELHRHLEACIRLSTIREIGPQLGINLPESEEDLEKKLVMKKPAQDLAEALKAFDIFQSTLTTPEIIERVAFEAVEDVKNEGISLVEFRYAPNFIAIRHPHLSFDQIHEAITAGISRGQASFDVQVGLIGIIVRTDSFKEAQWTADFIVDHRDSFVGMDLAGVEVGYDSVPFAPLFQKAKRAGLGITVHAGESKVPQAPFFVLDAIEKLGADRIGHGLQIHENPEVMKTVRDSGVTLELCPISNWLTQAVSSIKEHPIRKIMDAGIKVTVNTDDPVIFGSTLPKEIHLLKTELGFSDSEIEVLMKNAFNASFIRSPK